MLSSRGTVRDRIGELDLLRGFAIIAIVAIHVLAFGLYVIPPDYIYTYTVFFTHLADFGVPLFFFISGLLLAMRYFDKVNIREFYKRRVATIMPPVFAFSVIYLAFNWFFLGERSISQQLGALVLFDATGPFWFVAVILELYLLFPFLVTWFKRTEDAGRSWLIPSICLVIYVIWYASIKEGMEGIFGTTGPMAQAMTLISDRMFVPYLLFFVGRVLMFGGTDQQ